MIEPISSKNEKINIDEQYMRIDIDQAKIAEENGLIISCTIPQYILQSRNVIITSFQAES